MTNKAIASSFVDELRRYGESNGLTLIGAHFSWREDGTLEFFDDTPADVVAAVKAVYAAHEPTASAGVPQVVSRRQAHRALLAKGLLDTAEEMIAGIEDPMERRIAQIEWEAQAYERSSVFLQQFAGQLGLSPDQLDALFIQAAAL